MTTPTTGTIPALTEYQPAALTIASTVQVEITDSANASTAASYRMSQADFVGKAPSIMVAANPAASDLLAFYDVSESLPRVTSVGNLGIPSGNMPTGGATGTILGKLSATNFDANWINLSSLVVTAAGLTITGSTTITIGIQTAGIVSSMIADNQVGSTQFRQSAGLSLIGVIGTAAANVSDITMTNATQVMRAANATTIGFGALTTAHMPVQFQVGAFTSHGVAVTNATSALTGTNFGTTGMFLMGNGSAAAPSFSLVNLGASTSVTGTTAFAQGGTGTTTLATPWGVVYGGTTFLGVTAAGATGTLLAGQTATSAPAFRTISQVLDTVNTTQGSLLYRNAVTWTMLAAGTAGFVLQTLGTAANPIWVGSEGVLLNTIAASQIGSAVDTTSFTSRYSKFRIMFENICPVSTALLTTSLNMLIATSGVNWVGASYVSNIQTNVGLTTVLTGTTSLFLLSGLLATTSVGTSTIYGVNGFVELINPANAVFRKSINGQLNYITPGAVSTLTNALAFPSGFWDGAANAITGIAIAFQTGNIATGTIRVYGIS